MGEAKREGLTLRPIRHLWVPEGRKESSRWAAPVVSADIAVEPVVFGEGSLAAKMPLPCEEGSVATLFECLGQTGIFMRKLPDIFGGKDLIVALPIEPGSGSNPVRDAVASGVFPGHDAGTGGRADLTGSVAMSEADTLSCDTVNVRCLVVYAALDREVPDSQVISEDKEDIGCSCKRVGPCEEEKEVRAKHDDR